MIYIKELKNYAKDLLFDFTRTDGGYIEQIKRYLNIDFEKFDDSDIRNKREKVKIIYLLYTLKTQRSQDGDVSDDKAKKTDDKDKVANILKMLNSFSMENIDASVIGMKTYNGEYIKAIREKLGKEISKESKKRLHDAFLLCIFFEFFLKILNIIANVYMRNYRNDIALRFLEEAKHWISFPKKFNDKYELSPIEMFYFRILQFEEVGNIKDILFVNSIEFNCNVPTDMIKEMQKLDNEQISYDEIDDYISNNIKLLAPYIFLKRNIYRNDLKKLQYHQSKVKEALKYFDVTNFQINVSDVLNKLCREIDFNDLEESGYNIKEYIENYSRENLEFVFPSVYNKLHIISTYQAILLDDKDEIFEYTFSGYRKNMNTIRVQAALKPDQRLYKDDRNPVKALKTYWTRKIMDHFYANLGLYELRCKLREVENVSDNILMSDILTLTNPTDMKEWSIIYMHEVAPMIINMLKHLPVTPEEYEMLESYLQLLEFKDDEDESFE
ncbi:MAG: hypothetical protein NC452_11175 [Eubacterium sp.]|nr:hypothetical protein [Eubacterium sp.]